MQHKIYSQFHNQSITTHQIVMQWLQGSVCWIWQKHFSLGRPPRVKGNFFSFFWRKLLWTQWFRSVLTCKGGVNEGGKLRRGSGFGRCHWHQTHYLPGLNALFFQPRSPLHSTHGILLPLHHPPSHFAALFKAVGIQDLSLYSGQEVHSSGLMFMIAAKCILHDWSLGHRAISDKRKFEINHVLWTNFKGNCHCSLYTMYSFLQFVIELYTIFRPTWIYLCT